LSKNGFNSCENDVQLPNSSKNLINNNENENFSSFYPNNDDNVIKSRDDYVMSSVNDFDFDYSDLQYTNTNNNSNRVVSPVDNDILAQVLAVSQQEYLESLKAKRKQQN
jgi:hypothetical protein